jgi:hypothetical protein
MNTPTDGRIEFISTPEQIQIKRMLITEIRVSLDAPHILYQVPFLLSEPPSRTWKKVLMESWQSLTQHKKHVSKSMMWVFHNRILINNLPIDLVKKELENLLSRAIDYTNEQLKLSSKNAI